MIKNRFWWLLPSSMPLLLSGCNMALLDPKGIIGMEQKSLILTATWLMLIVVIPVIIMTFLFAWKYRASNKHATYRPNWSHSNKIEFVVWTIPLIIILILGTITWRTTHSLDPRNPIPSENRPLVIEAISLDWKWLFVYPEQGIATVNEIYFPANVPVQFKVTSGSVMNSFFIPQLGSQIYAMAGMQNQVHLMASEEGAFKGMSANYSGAGFSGMKFMAYATSQDKFAEWVAKVKQSPNSLQWADYEALAKPSEQNPVAYYASVKPDLYQDIINQFMGSDMKHAPMHSEEMNKEMDHDMEQGMHMSSHSGAGE
ncbi:ubiquinol oxidase subunit II [Tolumonas osonensis]|uniref:Ubiquinol oxidase subunit 2 n=1 Tax=Tolumonas osonensis TaxID=675874 RepID=A0A841GDJ5_9GAMM|nr:ubiquinol oxidase subunit II [Tolumonas osonensis]MBB6056009.1 cytochrome o ubiquinol oxidase subunit 2 [Tolumonas osonensis]